jgi:hypothetical protein
MKIVQVLVMAASLCSGGFMIGCETSHTETDKQGILGGNTHEETTTTKNPVTGDTNTTHTEQKTP